MKRLVVLASVLVIQFGCSKSVERPVSSTNQSPSIKENAVASSSSTNGEMPALPLTPIPGTSSSDAAVAYPENNEVLAILYRARELRQKWQFESALQLVSHALALDPSSPTAQALEREIAELLKRLRAPENQQKTGWTSRAA